MSKLSRVVTTITVGVLLLSAGGCGSTTGHTHRMSTEEVNLALDRSRIATSVVKCILAEDTGKGYAELPYLGAVAGELIKIFRKNPAATYGGETIHTILAKAAESLEHCWTEDARRIRTVLTYG
jgi:hypothetical protein